MAVSLMRNGFCIFGSNEIEFLKTNRKNRAFSPPVGSQRFTASKTKDFSVFLKKEFKGTQLVVSDQSRVLDWFPKSPAYFSVQAQSSFCISRSMRWWEKTLKPNMIEINSAQELVDSLLNAGDNLVIIDFYSPGCGGCRALHPKICQFAESNQNAIFLKVNYEELKTMCYSLNIHVLPFFRFYRGAEGRLCSFSCTNATIKKFKDALGKHGTERCNPGPAKGLEEAELLKLASNRQISLNFPLRSDEAIQDLFQTSTKSFNSSIFESKKVELVEDINATLVI